MSVARHELTFDVTGYSSADLESRARAVVDDYLDALDGPGWQVVFYLDVRPHVTGVDGTVELWHADVDARIEREPAF